MDRRQWIGGQTGGRRRHRCGTAPPCNGEPTAAMFTVSNTGDADDDLVGVTSPVTGATMLTRTHGGADDRAPGRQAVATPSRCPAFASSISDENWSALICMR
ncbi:copper chaperone PCu(A)C [Streptomyces humicola]|uniref:copper chaperone PCu(A)C n=1 Tax=Streptomyces humicola TaxID=2953240 RepID=UPI0035586931